MRGSVIHDPLVDSEVEDLSGEAVDVDSEAGCEDGHHGEEEYLGRGGGEQSHS